MYSPENEKGKAVSFYDINGDGWDDLSIARVGQDPVFLFNQGGYFAPAPFTIPNIPYGDINMLLWADYDNDGDPDLLITKKGAGIQLWRNNGNWQFTNVAGIAGLEQAAYFYFGAAYCDYDHDGCLDLYITKYYSYLDDAHPQFSSLLYRNNCNGTFTNVTNSAGVFLLPHPSFQPVFLDYDHDGWEDLFLVVDRLPHRNELFHNNGDGTFTNVTEQADMGLTICSMSATVGDYDHDGDLDLFVSNNPPEGQKLLRNDGDGTFTDVSAAANVNIVIASGWGGLWLDYDNNTWEDLLMTSTHSLQPYPGNLFYRNEQGGFFLMDNAILGPGGDTIRSYVCSRGDVNNDGYYDFFTNNRAPDHARLYVNNGGTNHWFAFTLEGTYSNRDGIGTWVHCYAGGEHFVRFTLCGEDLANQSSSKIIFGLAQHTMIDSLVLEWNRGLREVYYDLPVDQHRHFVEGASQLEDVVISYPGAPFLCLGGSLALDAGGPYASYLWNTGHVEQVLVADVPGVYWATVMDTLGFQLVSDTVVIAMAPENVITLVETDVSCAFLSDGSMAVSFSNEPVQSLQWNTGAQTHAITDLSAGAYSFMVLDSYGCLGTGGGFIDEPFPLSVQVSTLDASCHGFADGVVTVIVTGGTPPHDQDWNGSDPDALPAGEHAFTVVDLNGCTLQQWVTIGQPDTLVVSLTIQHAPDAGGSGNAAMTIDGGTPPYEVIWSNGTLDEMLSGPLPVGVHTVWVGDQQDCTWETQFVVLDATGIAHHELPGLTLRPNPSSGVVWVDGCPTPLVDVAISDMQGRSILKVPQQRCDDPIDLSGMRPGSYILRCTFADKADHLRFVLARH